MAQFSLTVSKSTGARHADESMRHLWKLFRWWFPSPHRLSFRWLFLRKQELRALSNPRVTFGRCLGDDFWVGSDLVFVDLFWVNRGCERFWIHASPLEGVSVIISESAATQLSLTISALPNPRLTFGRFLGDYFPVGTDLVFVDFFWGNRGCEHFRIHASPLEGVSIIIYESAATQLSLTISESIGAVSADKSMHHLWNRFHSRYRRL